MVLYVSLTYPSLGGEVYYRSYRHFGLKYVLSVYRCCGSGV